MSKTIEELEELTEPKGTDLLVVQTPGGTAAKKMPINKLLYRGINSLVWEEDLGTAFTPELSNDIRSGNFQKAHVGGFLTINEHKYWFAHADYRLHCGDTGDFTTHHMLCFPDKSLYTGVMNDTDTTAGAYYGSKMKTSGLAQALSIIKQDFGEDHILTYRILLANAISGDNASNWAWYDSQIDLMNECMVYGHQAWGTIQHNAYDIGADKTQLALFQARPDLITIRNNWWLRDVLNSTTFCAVYDYGHASDWSASNVLDVRPAFLVY